MPSRSEFDEIVRVASIAALQAGIVIKAAANRRVRTAEEFKGQNDVVTETDRRAQEVIEQVVGSEFPDHILIGEETHSGDVSQVGSGYRWIIDPVDGTTNFVHRFPPYAVSIGVMYDDELVAAAVLNVPSDELFTATKDGGTFLNEMSVKVSAESSLASSLIATGFPERSFDELERILAIQSRVMQRCRGIRRPGAASVDLASLACGRVDGFYEEGLQPWDIAAGILLVVEAGGRVCNYDGGEEVFRSKSIVATNGLVHEQLMECLR